MPDELCDARLKQYEIVNNRRAAGDTMLWQAPALCLTAQAFLFQVALQNGAKPLPIFVSMSLAFAAAYAAIHLMLKHRFYEVRDSKFADAFERKYSTCLLPVNKHQAFGISSVIVWLVVLCLFAIAAGWIGTAQAVLWIAKTHSFHWIGLLPGIGLSFWTLWMWPKVEKNLANADKLLD